MSNSSISSTNVTGSGNVVLATSPTLVTPTLGAATITTLSYGSDPGIIGAPSPTGTIGSDRVGYFIEGLRSNAGGALSLTSGTNADIITGGITVPSGYWYIWGNYGVTFNTSGTVVTGWLNTSSATAPDIEYQAGTSCAITAGFVGFTVPGLPVTVSGTQTWYLSVKATFAGTATAVGSIFALRIA